MEEKVKWTEVLENKRNNNRTSNPKEKEKPVAAALRDAEGAMGRRGRLIRDRLARFQSDESVEKPREDLPLHVAFEIEERSGQKVFDLKNVEKKMPLHSLGPIDLTVGYGERVLIVGDNGAGKTTLLNLLVGGVVADKGEISKGSRVRVGYMPQEEDLDSNAIVREEFLRHVDIDEGLGRSTLNRFRLSAEDMIKKVAELSSGERSRLRLAILMAQKPNCIVLDEPSNHLDLEVLESLEEALRKFSGTLIVVSHDRYFIRQVGLEKIYILENGRLSEIPSYERYEQR
jgi:ATPase subunit of ABC transporter with duplicated ATPase domains